METALLRAAHERRMNRAELLALGIYWLGLGVAVLPVRLEATPQGTRKRPAAAPNGYQSATLELAELERMIDKALLELGPAEALGLAGVPATGGFTFGDFDTKNGAAGGETLRKLVDQYPDAALCRYRSISGALNLIWLRPARCPDLSNAAPTGWHGFECRDACGYVVLPGTFTPWGAWTLDIGSVLPLEAWQMPVELAQAFKLAGESGARVASSPIVERYVLARQSYAPATRVRVDDVLRTFELAAPNGRHPALVRAVGQLIGLDRVDLPDALERLQRLWNTATAGEHREREPGDLVAWAIGRELANHGERLTGHGLKWAPRGTVELERLEEAQEAELERTPALAAIQPLPETFWQTPALGAIRKWAIRALVAPEAVAVAVLLEVLAHVSPRVILPATIGGPSSLNLYANLIAPSGIGKSSSAATARRFLSVQSPDVIPKRAQLGSGQGIVEAYLKSLGRNKGKIQAEDSVLFTMDEGAALHQLAGTRDSILLPTLRAAWNGSELGQANAGEDTRRHLSGHAYRLGLLVNFTPAAATKLLHGAADGTPQRWLWIRAQPFGIEAPPLTGPMLPRLKWRPPPTPDNPHRQEIILPPAVIEEIRTEHFERCNGKPFDPYDSHANLLRLKVAAALLLLDDERERRYVLELEHWEAAGLVLEHSNAVRAALLELERAEAVRKVHAKRLSAGADRVAEAVALGRHAGDECARRVRAIVWTDPAREWNRKELRSRVGARHRPALEEGLDIAVLAGWIHVRQAPGRGRAKRVIVRGEIGV